jgi:hypothetical protein
MQYNFPLLLHALPVAMLQAARKLLRDRYVPKRNMPTFSFARAVRPARVRRLP